MCQSAAADTTPMPTDKNKGKRAGEGEGRGESQTGEKTKNNRKQPDCHSSIGAQPQQLNGCVVEIKLKVDFDDGCCPSKWASPRKQEVGKGKFALFSTALSHICFKDGSGLHEGAERLFI